MLIVDEQSRSMTLDVIERQLNGLCLLDRSKHAVIRASPESIGGLTYAEATRQRCADTVATTPAEARPPTIRHRAVVDGAAADAGPPAPRSTDTRRAA